MMMICMLVCMWWVLVLMLLQHIRAMPPFICFFNFQIIWCVCDIQGVYAYEDEWLMAWLKAKHEVMKGDHVEVLKKKTWDDDDEGNFENLYGPKQAWNFSYFILTFVFSFIFVIMVQCMYYLLFKSVMKNALFVHSKSTWI